MKDKEAFRRYLTKNYRGAETGCPLSYGTACDVLTHCLRVERALGIELDRELSSADSLKELKGRIKDHQQRFEYTGTRPYFYSIFNLAVRYYYDFLVDSRSRGRRSKEPAHSFNSSLKRVDRRLQRR